MFERAGQGGGDHLRRRSARARGNCDDLSDAHARSVRTSWRALAAALAAVALAAPALAQDAAPAARRPARLRRGARMGHRQHRAAGRSRGALRPARQRHALCDPAPRDAAGRRLGPPVRRRGRARGGRRRSAARRTSSSTWRSTDRPTFPKAQLVPRLERLGLAFGADTNAMVSLEYTAYMLDLPRTDAATVDAALQIMRETASELTIAPEAVERERGMILSEYQLRNSPQRRRIGHYLTAALPGQPRRRARDRAARGDQRHLAPSSCARFTAAITGPSGRRWSSSATSTWPKWKRRSGQRFADWRGAGRGARALCAAGAALRHAASRRASSIPRFPKWWSCNTSRPTARRSTRRRIRGAGCSKRSPRWRSTTASRR